MPRALLSFTLLIVAFPCLKAEMTVKQYRETFGGKSGPMMRAASEAYILGLGSGIEQMNVELLLSNGHQLFCTPDSLQLGVSDYRKLIDREIDKFVQADKLLGTNHIAKVETYDIAVLLVKAFIHVYPCTAPKQNPQLR